MIKQREDVQLMAQKWVDEFSSWLQLETDPQHQSIEEIWGQTKPEDIEDSFEKYFKTVSAHFINIA